MTILTNVQPSHAATLILPPPSRPVYSLVYKSVTSGTAAQLGYASEGAGHYDRDCGCSGESVSAELCNLVTHDGAKFVEFWNYWDY